MVAISSLKGLSGSSASANSKSLPSNDGSERLRLRVVPPRRKTAAGKGPKENPKCTHEERRDYVRPYAIDALKWYNQQMDTEYELVEPGYISNAYIRTCFLHHIDFTAKKADVPEAPVEMFFAELTSTNENQHVTFCTTMGPKNLIYGDKNNGCCYCTHYNVQHPRGGGFMAGGAGLFTDENL